MPLTPKGTKIKNAMEKEYGKKKGEQVFYASKNAGRITGVDSSPRDLLRTAISAGKREDKAERESIAAGKKEAAAQKQLRKALKTKEIVGKDGAKCGKW